MYQAANREPNYHAFLQALASNGSVLDELIGFLSDKRGEYQDNLERAAIAALDDKANIPYALRQAGAVKAMDDLIFILGSYSNKRRSEK